MTFIAPVNAVRYVNAAPVFMDCDDYFNIHSEKTIAFIEKETYFEKGFSYNRRTDRRVSAIIPVHVFGNAVDLEPLVEICHERNITVVEDASESLGTRYTRGSLRGRHTGTVGEFGCYSFNGNKIITAGGGGMLVTNRSEWAERAMYLTQQAKDDSLHFVHDEIGYNSRLSNIHAAIGVAQLELLPEYVQIKQQNYGAYGAAIDEISGLRLADVPAYASNNCWMYPLVIDHTYGKNKEQLMSSLSEVGIQTRPIWHLNHLQKPYAKCQSYMVETASRLWEQTLNMPSSVGLTQEDLGIVVDNLRSSGLN